MCSTLAMRTALLVAGLISCAHAAAYVHAEHENDLALINTAAVRFHARFASGASAIVTLNTSSAVDGAFVEVRIVNPDHASGDFLAMYLADADPTATVPLKWTYCSPYLPGYDKTGTASAVFQVYNVRAPIVFALFSGGTSAPVLLARSPVLPLADAAEPAHARVLAGAGGAGAYAVAWTVGAGAANSNPRLLYGSAPDALTSSAPAAVARVERAALCGAPANATGWMDLGETAVANLDLAALAGQRVYYALADDAHPAGAAAPRASFAVPPLPGAPGAFPFPFIAFGDLGRGSFDNGITWREYGADSKATARLLAADAAGGWDMPPLAGPLRPAFLHHFGDISYATGYLQSWDEFLWMTSPYQQQLVTLIGVGNHESLAPDSASWAFYGKATDSGGECGVPTQVLLPMPAPASAAKPWYAHAAGPVQVVVVSTEHDFTRGSEQWGWLQATLAAVDRAATPWLIVSLHRPMYVDSNFGAYVPTGDIMVMNLLQEHVEPLTHAAKVSLIVAGHNHRWERISAVLGNKTVLASVAQRQADGSTLHVYERPRATVHALAGTAGAGYTTNDCVSQDTPADCPAWSERVVYEHGYLRLVALNATALRYDYVASGNGTVIDSMLLLQDIEQPWA